jgi:hypothetical protein
VSVAVAPKPPARLILEAPYRRDHERSIARRWERHPQTLRQHLRELREAWDAEAYGVIRLHDRGLEMDASPHWTSAFRSFVTGNDCDTTEDGDWRWPFRSSLFRLSVSSSGTDRLAAAYIWLLVHHRFHLRDAWARQCGPFADPGIADAAEPWAAEALRRWWVRYCELPIS